MPVLVLPTQMKMKQRSTSCLFLFFFVLLSLSSWSTAQEIGDDRGFSYIEGSDNGPEHWGDLKEEWATCKTGKAQSPINLSVQKAQLAPPSQKITLSYVPGRTRLKNYGYDVKLEWEDRRSKIRINGTDYILLNCHWHSPSEHTINGERFALEVHMVHQSADNKIAVVGQVYRFGEPNSLLSKLTEKLQAITEIFEEIDAGIIHPSEVIEWGSPAKYYRYWGSLTTPPCSEGVIWTVDQKVGTVSPEQVAALREPLEEDAKNNARPLQPLNGRKVHRYLDFLDGNHNVEWSEYHGYNIM